MPPLEEAWGATVTEAMGIGDIGVSLWGECEHQDGMHLGAHGFVHPELIDPDTEQAVEMTEARGRAVLTHLDTGPRCCSGSARATTSQVRTSPCPCGRTGPRIRCIGRTDDMLIVRGVNVFPSAVREVVGVFAPGVSGNIVGVRGPRASSSNRHSRSVSSWPDGAAADPALAERISARLRQLLTCRPPSSSSPGALPAERVQVQARQHEEDS